jgi:transcription antitermination factor NusG
VRFEDSGLFVDDAALQTGGWDPWAVAHTDEWISEVPGRWWVLHTRSRNEKVVATSLARHRVQYYLPLVRLERTYAKSRVTVRLPLFPGYLFLCGDHEARERAWKTKRVAKILEVDDQDQLRSELSQICRALESDGKVDLFTSLRKGRRCRITGGTLKGLEGVVLRRGRHCRMYLSVTMLGQSAVVEVDGALLETID